MYYSYFMMIYYVRCLHTCAHLKCMSIYRYFISKVYGVDKLSIFERSRAHDISLENVILSSDTTTTNKE